MSRRDRNAQRVNDAGRECRGDGEVRCLSCGAELDPDSAPELRAGLCLGNGSGVIGEVPFPECLPGEPS